jgi:hypothetical protein
MKQTSGFETASKFLLYYLNENGQYLSSIDIFLQIPQNLSCLPIFMTFSYY